MLNAVQVDAVQLPVSRAPAWLADAMDAGQVRLYAAGNADIRGDRTVACEPGDWIVRDQDGRLLRFRDNEFEAAFGSVGKTELVLGRPFTSTDVALRKLVEGDLNLHASGNEMYSDAERIVLIAAADEISRLKELLKHADDVVIWEHTPARPGFQEEIEEALGIGADAKSSMPQDH